MTSDPLSQDGRTAPALVQQGPFLRSLDLRSGQDKLLLKNVQLFGETCGCLWGWVGRAEPRGADPEPESIFHLTAQLINQVLWF